MSSRSQSAADLAMAVIGLICLVGAAALIGGILVGLWFVVL